MKKIITIIKKILFSFFLIYGFNIAFSSLNFNVSINIYTLLSVTIFGIPGFCLLIFLKYIIF